MITPVSLEDLLTKEPPPPNWLVEGLFLRGLIMILAGDPGAGKTALSQLLAHSLALGRPFLGMFPTKPTMVCYFDEENSDTDFRQYNQLIWRGLGSPALVDYGDRLNFYHFSLGRRSWYESMEEVLLAKQPGLVVIDTANPVFGVKEENNNDEALAIINRVKRLRRDVGGAPAFLILKHERQRDEGQHRTLRGAKVWLDASDRSFYHIIPKGCRKRKDGLRQTALSPDKMRSYGLECSVRILPEWTDPTRKGVIFKAKYDPSLDGLQREGNT